MSRKPCVRWKNRWNRLLGTMQDCELALRLNVSVQSVGRRRQALGIPRCRAKKAVRCACGKLIIRYASRSDTTCNDCYKAYGAQWRQDNADAVRKQRREWARNYRKTHGAEYNAAHTAWRQANREQVRKLDRLRWRRTNLATKSVIAELNALCEHCRMTHTQELRLRILRRMMPCTSQEIHEAWTCIWGPSGQEFKSSAGAQMLRRDLKKLGAISISRGDYILEAAA